MTYAVTIKYLFFSVIAFLTYTQSAYATQSANFRIDNGAIVTGSLMGASATFHLSGSGATYDTSAARTSQFTLFGTGANQSSAPTAPMLSNDSYYYDRLHIILNSGTHPTDTRYAIALSADNWATESYVDEGSVLVDNLSADLFHTYDYWGGENGTLILGLSSDTPYRARIAALHEGTSSGIFGPPSGPIKTDYPYVRMSITHSTTDFYILNTNRIAQAMSTNISISTNSPDGYQTYIRGDGDGNSGGLYDSATGGLIASDDMILAAGVPGYGAQATAPSALVAMRYAQTGNIVGKIDITNQPLSHNTVATHEEVTSIKLKVSIGGATTAGNYTDTIYYTATANL